MEQVPNYNARLHAIIDRITAKVCLAAVHRHGDTIRHLTDEQKHRQRLRLPLLPDRA